MSPLGSRFEYYWKPLYRPRDEFWSGLDAETAYLCALALEQAWDGVTMYFFDVGEHPKRTPILAREAPNADPATWSLRLAAPESVLVAHGLVEQRILDSIPPCGTCKREGLELHRGKRRTRLVGTWSMSWNGRPRPAADVLQQKMIAALYAFGPLRAWWQPRQAA